jgi:hypothetical protein
MLLSIMFQDIIKKISVFSFTTICIFTTAQSCSLNPFDSTPKFVGLMGIIKQDPAIDPSRFGPINAVKLLNNVVEPTALNNSPIIKIKQIDSQTLFVLTRDKGVLFSQNGGIDWTRLYIYPVEYTADTDKQKQAVFQAQLAKNDASLITDFWVNPNDIGVIYIAANEGGVAKIFKTIDGGANFTQVYSEVNAGTSVDRVLIDPKNSNHVYALLNKNALIQTLDGGNSWLKSEDYTQDKSDKIVQIDLLPELNTFFMVFEKGGVAISQDGQKWTPQKLTKLDPVKYKEAQEQQAQQNSQDKLNGVIGAGNSIISNFITGLDGFSTYKKIIPIPGKQNLDQKPFLLLADDSLWYSSDISKPFVQIKNIPVQESKINILDATVNPIKGLDQIYIAIGNKVLTSENRGQSWKMKDLGVDNLANISQIQIDPENPEVIYLGLTDGK